MVIFVAFALSSISLCSAQEYMTNSGSPPIPGAGHDYVRDLAETVNPANGSVSIRVRIPLPSGRGPTLPFSVSYDSSALHVIGGAKGPQWTWPYGGGFMLPFLSDEKLSTKYGGSLLCYYYAGYVFATPDGVSNALGLMKPLNPTQCPLKTVLTGGNAIVRADITSGTPKIATSDGTTYTFPSDAPSLPASIEDRNGNVLVTTFGTPTTFTDTLGRNVLSISPSPAPPPSAPATTTITVSGTGGNYYVNWTTPTVNFSTSWTNLYPAIQCALPTVDQGTARPAISSIQLPNGQAFTFTYDPSYGLVNEIKYPSGGWAKYTWGINPQSAGGRFHDVKADSNWCDLIYDTPAILHRYVSFDGTTTALQQDFSYSTTRPPSSTGWSSKQTTITTHDLTRGTQFQTIYTYIPGGTGDPAQPGTTCDSCVDAQIAVEQTVVYKDVSGATLKTENKTWYNVRQLESDQVTLNDGSTSETTYTYGPGDQITEKDEYDYGPGAPGPLLRKTVYNYQSFSNTAIFPNVVSVFDRPCQVITYDGTGTNRVAETDSYYDNGATTTVCGAAGTPSVASAGGTSLTGHDATNYGVSATGPRGNLTQLSRWLNTGGTVSSTYSYDETGQVLSVTDPNLNTTSYSYADSFVSTNSGGFTSTAGSPPSGTVTNAYRTQITDPTTNGVVHVENYSYGYNDGQLTVSKDQNGQSTSYGYNDPLDRLTEVDYPDAGKTIYAYNDSAPVSVTTCKLINGTASAACSSTSPPMGWETSVALMDGAGHAVQTQLVSDPDGVTYTGTTYDGLGHPYHATNPYRTTGDSTYGTTVYTYDALGRTTQVTKPDGSKVLTSYSGNQTTVTDEVLNQRTSQSDALGRLRFVWEAPNNSGYNYETDYAYDALSNLLSVNQKGGSSNSSNWRTRTFTYDSLSRLLCAANPEIQIVTCPTSATGTFPPGAITYTYDANGNLLSKVAPRPDQTSTATVTTNYSYDALNRLTQKAYVGLTTPLVKFAYDGATLSSCGQNPPIITSPTNVIGRRSAMCVGGGGMSGSSWSYDPMGRPLLESRINKGSSQKKLNVSYTYYKDGSLNTLTYPSGDVVTYTVGGAGRATQLSDPSNNYVGYSGNSAKYAPNGSLASMTNGYTSTFAGIATSNTYNDRLQPILLSASVSSSPIFSVCYDFHLGIAVNSAPCSFNAHTTGDNGNVFQVLNNVDSTRSAAFSYDPLNRLAQANTITTTGPNCWGEVYTIDPWGNLTNRAGVSGMSGCSTEGLNTSATAQNHLTGFSYDAAGNVTNDGSGNTPTYDAENRIAIDAGVTYSYDADGVRIEKSSGVMYWPGPGGEYLAETDLTGTINEEYTYFHGARIARIDRPSGAVHYYFSDDLGSASVITDASGNVQERYFYYPYGGLFASIGSDPNHYKFTGKERDSESNLDDFGARYYSSSLGRFMTPDWAERATAVPYAVFGDPETLNLYTYVENAPLNRADADGHGPPSLPSTPQGDPCGKDPGKSCDAMKAEIKAQNQQPQQAQQPQDQVPPPPSLRDLPLSVTGFDHFPDLAPPSFYQATLNVGASSGGSVSINLTDTGHLYIGGGGQAGKSPWLVGFSLTANWPNGTGSKYQSDQLASGTSLSSTNGYGIVVQESVNIPSRASSTGIGIGTPQAGGGLTRSIEVVGVPVDPMTPGYGP